MLLVFGAVWPRLTRADAEDCFAIEVIDDETERGVPLVELRTVSGLRFMTDSAGLAAIDDPDLMDRRVFFYVTSHGYEFPADGFGIRGRALAVSPGKVERLKLKRLNVAERLYRVTGAGIYRDTVRLGREAPIATPILNSEVTGSDSVLTALYREKVFWFWGDTSRLRHPLGNFHVPGALSELPSRGGLEIEKGVDLTYFQDAEKFARPMARMEGEGPTWITGLAVAKDNQGKEAMIASYVKIRPPLEVYRRGLAKYDDAAEAFQHLLEIPLDAPIIPQGHSFEHDGWIYFCDPFPATRAPAHAAGLADLSEYEVFTCLKAGIRSRGDAVRPEDIDRDEKGRAMWNWRKDTAGISTQESSALAQRGILSREDSRWNLIDAKAGDEVIAHAGGVIWNEYRRRFSLIATQVGGDSYLGEVWYSESETLEGPWSPAHKVASHDRYSFYNPKLHGLFSKEKGRFLFFEGTYTKSFSGNPEATPLYEYNQIMYKLDLAHPRLGLPTP